MIDRIIANVERCLALQRYHDDSFAKQLLQVQQWQQQRLTETYQVMLQSPEQEALIRFFLDEIYHCIDLTHLDDKLTITAKLVDKLFTDLQLVDIALEFNALNAELDESITRTLFQTMGVSNVTADNYAAAFRQENRELRERQLQLLNRFAEEARDCVNDNFVYNAFKLAKYPAKLGGLGSLHQMIARGFEAMRAIDAPSDLIVTLLDHERGIYRDLFEGVTHPFRAYSEG